MRLGNRRRGFAVRAKNKTFRQPIVSFGGIVGLNVMFHYRPGLTAMGASVSLHFCKRNDRQTWPYPVEGGTPPFARVDVPPPFSPICANRRTFGQKLPNNHPGIVYLAHKEVGIAIFAGICVSPGGQEKLDHSGEILMCLHPLFRLPQCYGCCFFLLPQPPFLRIIVLLSRLHLHQTLGKTQRLASSKLFETKLEMLF